MVTRIPFQGLKNTRDLGGKTGAGGRTLRPRMLLRGEALYKATPEDVRRLLNDYRLRLVVDLQSCVKAQQRRAYARKVELSNLQRMGAETEKEPDPAIPGVKALSCNLLDDSFFGIARDEYSLETWLSLFRDPSFSPERIFSDMYYKLVFDDHVRPMIKEIFQAVLACDGAALWHCSAGKDRAGVVTLLFLYALGVSREEIIADYLATRRFTYPDILKIRLLAPLKIHDRNILRGANVLMNVDAAYFRRIFDEIDARYRDEFDFFQGQYNIPPALILRLRDKYLADA